MPDWWESIIGSNPSVANQNDDPNGDGWTLLEDYLEFMAHPYLTLEPNAQGSMELKPYFMGFYGQNGQSVTPTYTVDVQSNPFNASIEGETLKVKASEAGCVGYCAVTVNDGETTFTQRFGVAVTGQPTGIHNINNDVVTLDKNAPVFDLQGRRISQPVKGLYIQKGKKIIIR